MGIKKEDRDKLFKLFGKLDCTKSINSTGIGLGLNICKQIVELIDGTIVLDENYREGTKFVFRIKCSIRHFYINQAILIFTYYKLINSCNLNESDAELQIDYVSRSR